MSKSTPTPCLKAWDAFFEISKTRGLQLLSDVIESKISYYRWINLPGVQEHRRRSSFRDKKSWMGSAEKRIPVCRHLRTAAHRQDIPYSGNVFGHFCLFARRSQGRQQESATCRVPKFAHPFWAHQVPIACKLASGIWRIVQSHIWFSTWKKGCFHRWIAVDGYAAIRPYCRAWIFLERARVRSPGEGCFSCRVRIGVVLDCQESPGGCWWRSEERRVGK